MSKKDPNEKKLSFYDKTKIMFSFGLAQAKILSGEEDPDDDGPKSKYAATAA